jgi:hypothetical protein
MKNKMENFCLENAFQLSFSVNFISKVFDFLVKNNFEVLLSIYFNIFNDKKFLLKNITKKITFLKCARYLLHFSGDKASQNSRMAFAVS